MFQCSIFTWNHSCHIGVPIEKNFNELLLLGAPTWRPGPLLFEFQGTEWKRCIAWSNQEYCYSLYLQNELQGYPQHYPILLAFPSRSYMRTCLIHLGMDIILKEKFLSKETARTQFIGHWGLLTICQYQFIHIKFGKAIATKHLWSDRSLADLD